MTEPAPLRAYDLLSAFAARGVSHVVGLPDNASAALFDLLLDEGAEIRLVQVTREGEAFAVAAGLWLGGARPAVVVQATGLLESGDALRGTVQRMGVPLPVLVTWRGWRTLAPAGLKAECGQPSREDLVRADVDSAALLLRPTLDAWGLPHRVLDGAEDAARVAEALDRAEREERPVALLLTRPLA